MTVSFSLPLPKHLHHINNSLLPVICPASFHLVLPRFPPFYTKSSVLAQHVTHKSVTPGQVIAPNGCQHAEMWGGHWEERSETSGEYPALSLWQRAWPHIKVFLGHESAMEIAFWQDEGRGTCTMFHVEAQVRDRKEPHLCLIIPMRH